MSFYKPSSSKSCHFTPHLVLGLRKKQGRLKKCDMQLIIGSYLTLLPEHSTDCCALNFQYNQGEKDFPFFGTEIFIAWHCVLRTYQWQAYTVKLSLFQETQKHNISGNSQAQMANLMKKSIDTSLLIGITASRHNRVNKWIFMQKLVIVSAHLWWPWTCPTKRKDIPGVRIISELAVLSLEKFNRFIN